VCLNVAIDLICAPMDLSVPMVVLVLVLVVAVVLGFDPCLDGLKDMPRFDIVILDGRVMRYFGHDEIGGGGGGGGGGGCRFIILSLSVDR